MLVLIISRELLNVKKKPKSLLQNKNANYKNITTNQTNNKIKGTGKHKNYIKSIN